MDKNDRKMMTLAVPLVDYWEMKDEIDGLKSTVDRLEKIVHTLINLYHQERVKSWELILKEMAKELDRKDGEQKRRKD